MFMNAPGFVKSANIFFANDSWHSKVIPCHSLGTQLALLAILLWAVTVIDHSGYNPHLAIMVNTDQDDHTIMYKVNIDHTLTKSMTSDKLPTERCS